MIYNDDARMFHNFWNWFCLRRNRRLVVLLTLCGVMLLLLGCRVQQGEINAALERERASAAAEREALELTVAELSARVETEKPTATPGIEEEAELLAKMLYGYMEAGAVRPDQQEYVAWCPINRVEDPRWPDDIMEVLRQENQWQGFSEDNPVIQDLLTIARNALEAWHSGGVRPVAPKFVFLYQDTAKAQLRTEFYDSATCLYLER